MLAAPAPLLQNLAVSGANQVLLNIIAGGLHEGNVVLLSPSTGACTCLGVPHRRLRPAVASHCVRRAIDWSDGSCDLPATHRG